MTVTADTLAWHDTVLRELALPLVISGERLRLTDGHARLGAGTLTLAIDVRSQAATHVQLEGHGVPLETWTAVAPFVHDTPVDFTLDVRGWGASVAAIAASSDGHFALHSVGEGRIRRTVENASTTVFGSLFAAFNPFRSKDEAAILECLAVEFPIIGGHVDQPEGLALRTQRMRVTGGGQIDFGTRTVSLAFTPEARRGVDLKSLNIVEAVVIEGPLAAPQVRLDSGNLLRRAATLGASVAIIGGSALRAALGNRAARGTLCPG